MMGHWLLALGHRRDVRSSPVKLVARWSWLLTVRLGQASQQGVELGPVVAAVSGVVGESRSSGGRESERCRRCGGLLVKQGLRTC